MDTKSREFELSWLKYVLEKVKTARDEAERRKAELDAHLAAGKSHESYLIGKIEAGATAFGVNNVTEYATGIDKAIDEAIACVLKSRGVAL